MAFHRCEVLNEFSSYLFQKMTFYKFQSDTQSLSCLGVYSDGLVAVRADCRIRDIRHKGKYNCVSPGEFLDDSLGGLST